MIEAYSDPRPAQTDRPPIASLTKALGAVVTMLLGFGCIPSSAAAQTLAPTATGSELALQGSLSGGYDANTLSGSSASADALRSPLFQGHSSNAGGNLRLYFSPPAGGRFSFGATAGSAFRVYQRSDFIPVSHFGSVSASAGLSPHISVQGTLTASYFPRYELDLLPTLGQTAPSQADPQPLDYSLSPHQVLNYAAGGGLSYSPTNRSSFSLSYSFRNIQTDDRSFFRGKTQDGYAGYHRNLTKGLGVRIGYRFQSSEYGDPATGVTRPVRGDNVDVGLDYGLGRGLSLSRRTTLSFSFGSAAYNNVGFGSAASPQDLNGSRHLALVGSATLTQQLFRSWSVSGAYNRGLHFLDGFAAPLFSDSATVRVDGRLSQRVSLDASFASSLGGANFSSATDSYHFYRSNVTVRAAVSRQFSLFAQYFYYSHAFSDATFLIQDAPSEFKRQGIRAGLSFLVPLVQGRVQRAGP